MSKVPRKHNETWCWNDEVAEAVRQRRKSMKIGKKEK